MKWKINKDREEEAARLNVQILDGVLTVNIDDVPNGMHVDDFVDYLINKGIVTKE